MIKTLWSVAIGLIGISVMILVHELGHFLAAKLFGIEVEAISFGFGPPIVKWGTKMRFQIGIMPFGGFCKLKGEDDLKRALARKDRHVENTEEGSLYATSPLKRFFLYFAGPLFNVLFAVLCFFILLSLPVLSPASPAKVVLASDYPQLFSNANPSPAAAGLKTGMTVSAVDGIPVSTFEQMQTLLGERRGNSSVMVSSGGMDYTITPVNGIFGLAEFISPVVSSLTPDSPEDIAGLRSGDVIQKINDNDIENMFDILLVRSSCPASVSMTVLRGTRIAELSYEPLSDDSGRMKIGFTLKKEGKMVHNYTFSQALVGAFRQAFSVLSSGFRSLADLIQGKGKLSSTVAGTFSASTSIGELTTAGFHENFSKGLRTALYLLAGVSISLAIANLLPIPTLDGGLMLLSFVEMIAGKNASPKVYLICQVCGFAMVGIIAVLMCFG